MTMHYDPVGDALVGLLRDFVRSQEGNLLYRAKTNAGKGPVVPISFDYYDGVIVYGRGGDKMRVDVIYCNPCGEPTTLRSFRTLGWGLRVSFDFSHLVIRDGQAATWWWVRQAQFGGWYRLNPWDTETTAKSFMARHMLAMAGRYRKDTYELRKLGFNLAGKTVKAALGMVSGGSAVVATEALAVPIGKIFGQWSALTREKRIAALKGHMAVFLGYFTEKQRWLAADAKASLSGWDEVAGYRVRYQFANRGILGIPDYCVLRYSGPGTSDDQVDQGIVRFAAGGIASWWYLGLDGKKRLKLV